MGEGALGPTNETLTRERNRFWLWMLALVVASFALPWVMVPFVGLHGAAKIAESQTFRDVTVLWQLLASLVVFWRVWILCRVLQMPWWWASVYSVCAASSRRETWVIGLIPLVGVTLSFRKARAQSSKVVGGTA